MPELKVVELFCGIGGFHEEWFFKNWLFSIISRSFWSKHAQNDHFIWKNLKKGLIKAKNDLKGLPTELEFEILSAVDINNNVLGCYRLNNRKIEDRVKNADCTAYEWEKVAGYNTLVCSPPCQESLKIVAQFNSRALFCAIFVPSLATSSRARIFLNWAYFWTVEAI